MKRLIPALAMIFGWVSMAAAAPAPLTTLRAVRALSNAEASQALPVAFEATVTFFLGPETTLFVQDGDQAIFVSASTDLRLLPGDRILVEGKTHADFSVSVRADRITLLGHGDLPKPVQATFDDLIRARLDCRLVTVRAVVRAADLERRDDLRSASRPEYGVAQAQLLMEDGGIEALIETDDESALPGLLDAEVQITGVAGLRFDGKMRPTGAQINVSSLGDVKVLGQAAASWRSLPITPMDDILAGYRLRDLSQRVRIHGTITYYQPGTAVVLQSGSKSLWIATKTTSSNLRINDGADATGFPDTHIGFLTLTNGEVWDSNAPEDVPPLPATWKQLASSSHPFDLVQVEGEVVTVAREAYQDVYVLSSDGQLFTAILGHLNGAGPPMKKIPPGSRVRVTGICTLENSNPFDPKVSFDILTRTTNDIVVVANPSLLNIRNLILLVCALLLIVFAVLARGWALERKVRHQSSELAQIEQRRSRILEDINGSRPLAEIIEEITKLASFNLHGSPCWCQIAGGARLGNCPPCLTALRIVESEIPARSGPPLGVVFAAFDPLKKSSTIDSEALSMAVALAALAIETRRLYSDLLHRSEFDLLTDIHNRFSLGKRLDALIDGARENAGIFGLIYIDLDGFKQVNDLYGHHIGDLYLQEVALRMKQQLRSQDLLARLGGDEFAILLPLVRNRAGVEEIALRLEACFDEPLVLEGQTLKGAASFGIALYPEDGATGDGLLGAADTAMYAVKNSRKQSAAESKAAEHESSLPFART